MGHDSEMADTKKDKSASNTRMPAGRAEGDDVNADGSPVVAPAFVWPDAGPGDPGAFNSSSGSTGRDTDKKERHDG
jgi:hypothetical protein